MTLSKRLKTLRKANPDNIYELDTKTRSIYLLVPKKDGYKNVSTGETRTIYNGILVYTESETEAY